MTELDGFIEYFQNVPQYISYRSYELEGKSYQCVLYNSRTMKYCFLNDISAQIFHYALNNLNITNLCNINDISLEELSDFFEDLIGFCSTSIAEPNNDLGIENTDDANNSELSEFMNNLYLNHQFFAFHIDITKRCNENCIHCYNTEGNSELNVSQIKEIIDSAYNLGVYSITLSGGEALLHKNFWDIIEYINSKKMKITLFTNGIAINQNTAEKIYNYGISKVSISLYSSIQTIHDSITNTKNSFIKTINAINYLKKLGCNIELKSVVLKNNITTIGMLKKYAAENGLPLILDYLISPMLDGNKKPYSYGLALEDYLYLLKNDDSLAIKIQEPTSLSNSDLPCYAGRYSLYCDSKGIIYPCVGLMFEICNYRELCKILDNDRMKKWLSVKKSNFIPCGSHDYCNYCIEQCAGVNLLENGNILNANTHNCLIAKAMCCYKKTTERSNQDEKIKN